MITLPIELAGWSTRRQFILYVLAPDKNRPGKTNKFPVDYRTLRVFEKDSGWQEDPTCWTDFETAAAIAQGMGTRYGVGFFFTSEDPFFFVDIDDCLDPDTQAPDDRARDLIARFPGAAVEVSSSGKGLHIFGRGLCPPHSNSPVGAPCEFYTERRFAALTGNMLGGSVESDHSATLARFVSDFFPFKATAGFSGCGPGSDNWTTEPVSEWNGPEDDDELIAMARKSTGAAGVFRGVSKFEALWTCDTDELAVLYPDQSAGGVKPFNASAADLALLQFLAFWTGKNCERMERIFNQSDLVREKWSERDAYRWASIEQACHLQTTVYSAGDKDADDAYAEGLGAGKLKGTDGQVTWAKAIRADKLREVEGDKDAVAVLTLGHGPVKEAAFWIENREKSGAEFVAMATPIDKASDPLGGQEPEVTVGLQFLGVDQQIEHFKGCVYVQDEHKVFTPRGALLKPEQFNATYGGYVFQLDSAASGKTTRKAWDAFVESMAVRYPKAETTCFRPLETPGAILSEEGKNRVNTYIPVDVLTSSGDPSKFLAHLAKVLPDQRDRDILLAYMAACVQHRGVKFRWAPLIQGVPGNGKTLFTWCVAYAVGERYTHLPPAKEISEKFNDWLFEKLFIGVEDIYVPEHRADVIEALKPMITNQRLAMRAMQQGQKTRDVYANFILNCNRKDSLRKTKGDRRFAPFFTAQQKVEDLDRDGMGGDYFPDLYDWLKGENAYAANGRGHGYSIVAKLLAEYEIPAEFNPAGLCHRAPETSATVEAIEAGLGTVEQEILEAIAEGRPGFLGGWISSCALDDLLKEKRKQIAPNKRREILQDLGFDWHPALDRGRANQSTVFDKKRPTLFIKAGHISANIAAPKEVAAAYDRAQEDRPDSAASVFGQRA